MKRVSPAERLLQSFGITEPHEIDLEAIAWEIGIEISEERLDGCEAQIIGNGDKAHVIIDSRASKERTRFSIDHEMVHWEHHRGKAFICRSDDIGNNDKEWKPNDPERVADDYAADLLMPQYIFEPLAGKAKNVNFDVVMDLKDKFETSITAAALRFIQFSPVPSMLVCHDVYGRKWFRHGKGVPNTLFPKAELDAEGYAMDVLYKKLNQVRPNKIGADAWFDKYGADRYEIHEHTVHTYGGRILTLLSWEDEEMLEKYAA